MSTRSTPRFPGRMAAAALVLVLMAGVAPEACAQPGSIDVTFLGTGASGRVASSAMQLDGKVVIVGSFVTYNGTTVNRVARLLRNGLLDPGFTMGTGFNAQVNSVAIGPDGKAVIVGNFTSYNATARNRIVRLNTDGTLDLTFGIGTGFNGQVTGVTVQPDGKVIAVGDFTLYNGTGRNRVARLNTDGTLDGGFNPGSGANFFVSCVALQSDGKVLIGGLFNSINGNLAVGIARLTSTGAYDPTFSPGGAGLDNGVDCITLQPDGKALVGGLFTLYNVTSRNRILRLNTNGTLDTSFNPGVGVAGPASRVLAIQVQSDGSILLGGVFTSYNATSRTRLARVSSTGAVDGAWTAGANDAINTLLWIPEGKVIAGGLFTSISATGRNRIARLKAVCTDSVQMVVATDGNAFQTSWEIRPQGYTYAACSGSGFPNNAIISSSCCLAEGCYLLRVSDSGGDGITNGGYVLKSESGDPIINDSTNFTTGSLSAIANNEAFCIPLSTDGVIYTSCGKLDWTAGQYIVARPNAAVSAEFGVTNATSGYEFWFFDPNGGYTFRRFRNHATSDGFAPNNATRACHAKINNWGVANHLQPNVLYNVRVRGRVNGVNGAFGLACRFMIDPLRAQCPLTKLMDIPGNPNLSCGQTRAFGPGNYVHARPVAGANKYQFRFQIVAESFTVTRTSNNYFLLLNWVTNPLQASKTYEVDVRASKDGGATWCSDFIPPPLDPWGDVCLLTISSSLTGGDDRMALDDVETFNGVGLALWPNPCAGEQLDLRIDGLPDEASTIDLVVMDLMGRTVHQGTVATSGTTWTGQVNFAQRLESGTYVVQAVRGTQRWTQRFVVEE